MSRGKGSGSASATPATSPMSELLLVGNCPLEFAAIAGQLSYDIGAEAICLRQSIACADVGEPPTSPNRAAKASDL